MGLAYSLLRQQFPPKSQFTVDDIPDLSGKVVIVTGGNAGIGKETVKALLSHNAKVYILTRNRAKAEHAIAELKVLTEHEAFFIPCDFSDLRSVKEAAEEYKSKEKTLHVLINNAGVMFPPINDLTAQGYDLQIGTNALGHFYLTKLLLPTLLFTAESSGRNTRVVNVSSIGHHFGTRTLDFNTFRDTPSRRKLGAAAMYPESKFANIVFSVELARRYGDRGITSVALHPGSILSELNRNMPSLLQPIYNFFLYPTATGALTQLYAATRPEIDGLNGKYFVPWARLENPHKNTQDPKLGREFWEWCEEQVKDI